MTTRHAPPAPKQSRSALSTTRLLDAAAELIAERGYERMTLAAIGERAGYSPALVTARFGSKEGLLAALVDRMAVDWAENVLAPAIAERSGADAVHTVLAELHRDLRRTIEERIAAAPGDAAVEPASAAQLIVGALRGAVYQSLLDPVAVPMDAALDRLGPLVDALLA